MFSKKYLKLALLALLLVSPAFSQADTHKCTHDSTDKPEPEVMDPEMEDSDLEGRTLASTTVPLKITASYDALNDGDDVFNAYVQAKLIPPILDYFAAALQVKYPLGSSWKMSTSTICSGIPTPADLQAGIGAQFYWVIADSMDTSSNWIADSYACNLRSGNKRPYIARTKINRDQLGATTSVLVHEKNMVCIMHELVHTLGFSSSLYKNFIDASGTKLTGHVTTQLLDGANSTVLNIEPLTTKLRNHFGCSTLKGAYMENSGGSGTTGSHFERRQFAHEIMTSGLIYEMAVSEFTLAVLDGSGWYVANYTYAEPFAWGKGQGCSFLTGTCSASKFDEFCTGSTRGCTTAGSAGGACASDIRSDSCRFQHPRLSYHCENPNAVDSARLPSIQTFGRGAGSKCFAGTLSTTSTTSQTSFCFKYSCSGTGTNTKLTINVGSTAVVCSGAGAKTVTGYTGSITCPDPLEYCSTIGKLTCPRNCMGRGTCKSGKCVCKTGFSGSDCGLPTTGL